MNKTNNKADNKTKVLQAYKDGVEINTIFKAYSIKKTTLYRWLRKAGIPKRGAKPRFNESEIQEIRKVYAGGESITSITTRLKSANTTISALIEDHRSLSDVVRKYDDNLIGKIINAYSGGLTSDAVAVKFNVSPATVLRFLKQNNVSARKIEYECDESFFDNLDSEFKLYWFGFILADGSLRIRKNASNFLEINLGLKDKHHLELFTSHIGYTGPIREITVNHSVTKKTYIHANLKITRKRIVDSLKRLGVLDVKAGSEWPLTIFNDEELRHILRGFFDGDGSIGKQFSYRWYICGPNKEPLEYFMSRCPVVSRWNATGKPMKYRVTYGGNQIVPKICKWLYRDANVYLERKRKIWKPSNIS